MPHGKEIRAAFLFDRILTSDETRNRSLSPAPRKALFLGVGGGAPRWGRHRSSVPEIMPVKTTLQCLLGGDADFLGFFCFNVNFINKHLGRVKPLIALIALIF